jgi:hypothetical protein
MDLKDLYSKLTIIPTENEPRPHHHSDTGEKWSDIIRQILKQSREDRLEREKIFGKPKSKYHD